MRSTLCKHCGATFVVKKAPQQFCGRACWSAHLRRNGDRVLPQSVRGRVFRLLLEEGLLTKEELAKRLGVSRVDLGRMMYHINHRSDDVEIYIGLTDSGKHRAEQLEARVSDD